MFTRQWEECLPKGALRASMNGNHKLTIEGARIVFGMMPRDIRQAPFRTWINEVNRLFKEEDEMACGAGAAQDD